MQTNRNSKQIKTISIIMVLTLAGKILGLVRDMLLGYHFATGMASNAFLTASRIPRNFFDAIFASAISASFIPVFNEYLENKGRDEAYKLSNAFISVVGLVTVGISAVGMIFAKPLTGFLADGFDAETAALCASLLRIMFPAIFLTGLAFCFVGILQSMGEFNIPALLSTASNLVIIVYYVFFCDDFGIKGLAAAFLIGWAVQCLIQFPSLIKKGYRFRFSLHHEGLRKIFLLVLPVLISTWVQPVNSLVATKFASRLNGGAATSALDYANTLYTIIAGVVVLSIANVVFPEFSKLSAKGDKAQIAADVSGTLSNTLFIIVPMSVGLSVVSKPLIRLFYERGAWGSESTALTSAALSVLSLGMIAFGIQIILTRAFYAQQKGLAPLISGLVSVLCNIVLCAYLSPRLGITGLAIASVVSMLLSALILLRFADSNFSGLVNGKSIFEFIKILFCSAIMGAAVYFCRGFIESHVSDGLIGRAITLFAPVVIGIILYFVLALIFGLEALKQLKLDEKWYASGIYKFYRKICDKVKKCVYESAIIGWWCNPSGKLWDDSREAGKLRRSIGERFERSGLKKSFDGSIFLQSFIWCGLAVFLAPLLPTMGVLALCAAGFFSVALNLIYDYRRRLNANPFNWFAAVFALFEIEAAFTSVNIGGSLYPGLLSFAFVLFAPVFFHSIENRRQLDVIVDLLILAAAAVAGWGVIQYVFGLGYQSGAWTDSDMFSSIGFRVSSTFQNPNMLGHYFILMIPVGGARLLSCKKPWGRAYYFCCCAAMCLCMVLTFSRGAWLGLLFAAVIFFALLKPQILLLAPIAAAGMYFVLPDSIISRFTSIGNLSDKSSSYRVSIWTGTLKMLKEKFYWLRGIGPGEAAYNSVYPFYSLNNVVAPHSHNLFLQIVCDGGVLMLLVFLAVIVLYVRLMCKAINHETDRSSKLLQIAFLAGPLGFLLQGMTDYSFYNYRLMFMFFACLCVGALCAGRSRLAEGKLLK